MILPFDNRLFVAETAELDAWARRLDERILSRRWAGRLRRALEAEAVAASTSMEGVPITVDEALWILAGETPEEVRSHDQRLVRGYRDAMAFVQRRADDGLLEWTRELIVGVQDRVLAGSVADGAGRLRTGATWIRNAASGQVVFQPPDHEEVPALVDEICATMGDTDWHPALAAAWVHVAVAAVHPFKDGNGRTARVLASLAMYRGGFRHPAFTSLEEWWGRHTSTYYAAFDCLGTRFDGSANVTPFVAAHIAAQLHQVRALALRQRTEGMLFTTLENLLEDRGLQPRLANALYDSFFGRTVTTGYYRDLIDASLATARNDLAAAVGVGLLDVTGRTKGRRYRPGPELLGAVAGALGDVEADEHAIAAALVDRAHADFETPPPGEPSGVQPPLPGLTDR